ncbi:related to UNG1-Uracil-DNA glycosylase [Sporisorium reilianum f. sp. reilianum]|uniref:Uracil-DNA glycosylase n=1 Tax=Sporisorium reilianum f. sp. reilianum TaxID=72559 RepID=A0A2N8UDC5_9BASI|nr:related to UNG1-Uracil-DNA glycosylase [Sporisorium reilianum f. sp. reilianum]
MTTTRTTLSKRDANTLASDAADAAQAVTAKRAKTEAAAVEADEFDALDQDLDDQALLAAAEEIESAASNQASSQATAPTSQTTPSRSSASTPRPSLKQATLFSTPSSTPAEPLPKLQPPSDLASDPLWLERQTMSPSWFDLLQPEMNKPYFSHTLKAFLAAEDKAGKKTYPPRELIYSWSRLVPSPRHVRVVVVGQDPYHGPNQACGLSFSVPKGVRVPPSLRNIYKELAAEYPAFRAPSHGCLDGWARQGVLLLNACLTVSAGAANSHNGKGWEGLTRHILKKIADEAAGSSAAKAANASATANSKIATMFAKVQNKTPSEDKPTPATAEKSAEGDSDQVQSKGVVFLVWGTPAAKTLADAGVTDKNANILILKSPHPSPLSAHRGFLGNGHFKKANDWLKQRYGDQGTIDWSKL